jgi:hypothetical protein
MALYLLLRNIRNMALYLLFKEPFGFDLLAKIAPTKKDWLVVTDSRGRISRRIKLCQNGRGKNWYPESAKSDSSFQNRWCLLILQGC